MYLQCVVYGAPYFTYEAEFLRNFPHNSEEYYVASKQHKELGVDFEPLGLQQTRLCHF